MPRRKITKKKVVAGKAAQDTVSYKSLLIGVISVTVFIVLVVLAVKFLEKRVGNVRETESITSGETVEAEINRKTYTVEAGDTLWSIAEKFYNSGYYFVNIVQENKIVNPNKIEKGTVLIIPEIESGVIVKAGGGQTANDSNSSIERIEADTYTVVKGDNLWKIAVRAYGDGFKWVDIARVNNLANPSIIHAGNVFRIPR